jgi:multiple sugar transport system substrate-binding protein
MDRRTFLKATGGMALTAATFSPWNMINRAHAALTIDDQMAASLKKRFDGVTIRMVGLRDISTEIALKKVPEFTQKTGIQIKASMLEFEEMCATEKMDFLSQAGAWDVVAVDQPSLGEYVTSGWIYPLTEFIEDKTLPDLMLDDLIPAVTKGIKWEGVYYDVAMGAGCNLFGYRKDLFEQHGLPGPPQSWQDFLAYAKELNDPPKRYGIALFAKRGEYLSYDMTAYFGSWGSGFIDENKQILFDNDAGLEAMEFYADLLLKHKVAPPGSINYGHPEFTQSFQTGLTAMGNMIQETVGEPLEDPKVSKVGGKIAYGVVPGKKQSDGSVRHTPAICSHSFGINKNSKNKAAAFCAIHLMTTQGEDYMLVGGRPTRKSHFSKAVTEKYPVMAAMAKSLPLAVMRPNIPEYPSVSEIFSTNFHRVLSGEVPLEKTMKKAGEDARKIMAKAYPDKY